MQVQAVTKDPAKTKPKKISKFRKFLNKMIPDLERRTPQEREIEERLIEIVEPIYEKESKQVERALREKLKIYHACIEESRIFSKHKRIKDPSERRAKRVRKNAARIETPEEMHRNCKFSTIILTYAKLRQLMPFRDDRAKDPYDLSGISTYDRMLEGIENSRLSCNKKKLTESFEAALKKFPVRKSLKPNKT